jgi:hypothetical protein
MMKKRFGFLMILIGLAMPVFAQTETDGELEYAAQTKHQSFSHYLGPSLGVGAMRMNEGAIFTFDIGASYSFYLFDWLSISGSVIAHQELYLNQPSDDTRMVPAGNPFCITVPIGLHFNVPKAEWLYAGFNFALNFPMFNMNSPQNGYSTEDEIFISLPIDFGLDLMKPGKGGSRVFLTVTPTFHKGGIAVPVGFVWQIHNWRIGSNKTPANVSPQPPTIIIIN